MKIILFFFLVESVCCVVCGYQILVVLPTSGKSHHFMGMAIARSLVESGNNVTVITSFEENTVFNGGEYTIVFLEGYLQQFSELMKQGTANSSFYYLANQNPFENVRRLNHMGYSMVNLTFEHPKFKKFVESGAKFDVVIVEQFFVDALKGLGCYFNAPLIAFSTGPPNGWVNPVIGNPWPPSYIPDVHAGLKYPMNLWERFWNTIFTVYRTLNFHYVHIPEQNTLMKKYFPHCSDLNTLAYNVSLFFLNGHESYSQAMPDFPTMINIGGIHMEASKKMSQILKEFMDNATEGVVYFSMGSYIDASKMASKDRDTFINVFGKINQKVLWKWEKEKINRLPDNVILDKWFPQEDILSHPNLKVFISHGGIASIVEATRYGVPLLILPVLGDQYSNGIYAQYLGYAINIPFREIEEETLLRSLRDLMNDTKYAKNAKKRSALFLDRPMKPKELVVYWTEFVIRNKGTNHLKVAVLDMPYYKYFLLDIIVCIVLAISILVICIYTIIGRLLIHIKSKQD